MLESGFIRLWHSEHGFCRIEDKRKASFFSYWAVIDRLHLNEQDKSRVVGALSSGFKLGKGKLAILEGNSIKTFSDELICENCQSIFQPPTLSLFSANSPNGACEVCHGFGKEAHIDWQKVIPDQSMTITSKGIAPLSFGSHEKYYEVMKPSARKKKISCGKKFSDYTPGEWDWLKNGDGAKTKIIS